MAEKPILFNTEMVRAILDGRKTQTRRLVKPQPQSRLAYCYAGTDCGTWGYPTATAHEFWGADFELPKGLSESEKQRRWKPPCEADDILWVRETWNGIKLGQRGKEETSYWYRADEYEERLNPDDKWRPSIHMPREAARLFLLVKKVRIERLQDISDADIKAEGTDLDAWYEYDEWQHAVGDELASYGTPVIFETMHGFFGHRVWDNTMQSVEQYERYGWEANPWVWVIEFERVVK